MTPEESARTQARTGALTQLLVRQLGTRFLAGDFPEAALVAAWIAAQRIGHDRATADMATFISGWRRQQAPNINHPDPVLAEFTEHLAAWRAWQVATAARNLDSSEEVQQVLQRQAAGSFRDTLNAGRATTVLSAHVARRRWRRKTSGKACSWCVMLATRSDYTSLESAVSVQGRKGRLLGSQPMGNRYHDHCTCTAVEVIGEWEPTELEAAQQQLYQEARKAAGRAPSTPDILAQMRRLGGGTLTDAIAPDGGGAGVWGPILSGSRIIPRDSRLAATIGEDAARILDRHLRETPHRDAVNLWLQHIDDFTFTTTRGAPGEPRRAFFRPGEGITFDLGRDMRLDGVMPPGRMLLHETAHAIDWLHRTSGGKLLSRGLLDGMGEDLEELWTSAARLVRPRTGETTKDHQERILQLIADDVHHLPRHAWIVDDMLQAAWGEGYPAEFGHGEAYWRRGRDHRRAAEAFAEMMEAQLCNPEAWAAIKQRLPRTAAAFDELIREALK